MGRFSVLGALLLLCATSGLAQDVKVRPVESPSQIEIGAGVTFDSFNEVPSTTTNNFGVNASVVAYHDWLGSEGQVSDTFGSQGGQSSQLLFAGAGIRVRWPTSRSIQPWAHGVVGYSRFSPNAVVGNHSSVGDKAGGGVDIIPHHGRLKFRVSADVFNTNFFHTHQVSPEVSVGVVLSLDRRGPMGH
ncbi:MAG: hypothetical protein WCA98_12815 [Candidatus Acidiferrales bacterium]